MDIDSAYTGYSSCFIRCSTDGEENIRVCEGTAGAGRQHGGNMSLQVHIVTSTAISLLVLQPFCNKLMIHYSADCSIRSRR